MSFRRFAAVLATLTVAFGAAGQPRAVPLPPPTTAPRDVPYPGVIALEVDARDVERGIFRVRERIPVAQAGPLTLLYPEWLPGKHAPRGPINLLSGIAIRAGGEALDWRRDPVNVYAFHVDVPAGTDALELEFQYVSPTQTNQGRVVVTREMLNLQWEVAVLYPAGHYASRIRILPSVTLPQDWKFAAALDGAVTTGVTTRFAETDLETLVDSPLFAGRHYRLVDLDRGAARPVRLNLFADRPDQLAATVEQIEPHRALVQQAYRLFGSQHFDHYDFLLALTDRMGGIGLEHHRSSENGVDGNYFTDWPRATSERDLLAHEFVHSWNGKFRRPADLWTPGFETPMLGSLLWVYEGLTQYYGFVLAARSGLWSQDDTRAALALTAATYQHRVGREWRSVADTTNDPVLSARRPAPWRSWLRNEDYYSEGLFVWLDADTLIRERTDGRRSLDDFARAFFGIDDGSWACHVHVRRCRSRAERRRRERLGRLFRAAHLRNRRRAAARRPRARRLPPRVQRRAQRISARSGSAGRQRRLQLFARVELWRQRQRHGRAVGRPCVQRRHDGRHAGRRRQRRLVRHRSAASRGHGGQEWRGADRAAAAQRRPVSNRDDRLSRRAASSAPRTRRGCGRPAGGYSGPTMSAAGRC
jgi:predicted metalloprotease with PDZ domain